MNNSVIKKEAMGLVAKISNKTKIKNREKNVEFMKKYGLVSNEVKNIVKDLKDSQFINRVINKDPNIDTDYLYEFYTTLYLNNEYGISELIPIYIKICELRNNEIILIVSFHNREL